MVERFEEEAVGWVVFDCCARRGNINSPVARQRSRALFEFPSTLSCTGRHFETCSAKEYPKGKNEAGGTGPYLIICSLPLIVELQGELDLSSRLRSGDNAGGRLSHSSVGNGQVNAVKGVQEIRTELQSKALGDREVLHYRQIGIES